MKLLFKVVATLATVLILLVAAGWWWLGRSVTPDQGSLALPGLQAPVEVARDARGVPTIAAKSQHDAYFALGVVHAQDRLWQMESQRRLGAGRLSELVGARALGIDRTMRALGIYRLAQAQVDGLAPEVRAALDAYAAGVNSWLNHRDRPLPPEFTALQVSPEPWTPADSLVWGRLMALRLAGNWQQELVNQQLAARLPVEKLQSWEPGYPPSHPVTVGQADQARQMLANLPPQIAETLASNVWALDGTRSVTGKPLLANDPHLDFQMPILWYLAAIEAPGLTLTGATVPGVPFHLLGHNGQAAWGITTTHADTSDLFIEQEAGPGLYAAPEGPLPFETRREVITVRGGEDVTLTVRATRHGPVISDVLADRPGVQGLLALSSAALLPDDRTVEALYALNRATDWRAFEQAAQKFHAPMQNLVFAGAGGEIAFISAGRVPVRKAGDGLLPRPGWTGEHDWLGWVPFEDLPRLVNPAEGAIVNANNKVVPPGYPWLIAAQWPEGFRAERIIQVLSGKPQWDLDQMQALQMDDLSLAVQDLLPRLLSVPPATPRQTEAQALLGAWDGRMSRGRPEPLLAEAWLVEVQKGLMGDDLGDLTGSFLGVRPYWLANALAGEADWCNDVRTPVTESCDTQISAALDRALDGLTARYGAGMTDWRWGIPHQAAFEHGVFRHLPWLGEWTGRWVATDGGDFTVSRGSWYGPDFTHVHGAGFRAVYDLADLSRSRFIIATGQSGNPLSAHYDDLMQDWAAGRLYTILPGTRLTTLSPAGGP